MCKQRKSLEDTAWNNYSYREMILSNTVTYICILQSTSGRRSQIYRTLPPWEKKWLLERGASIARFSPPPFAQPFVSPLAFFRSSIKKLLTWHSWMACSFEVTPSTCWVIHKMASTLRKLNGFNPFTSGRKERPFLWTRKAKRNFFKKTVKSHLVMCIQGPWGCVRSTVFRNRNIWNIS